MCPVVNGDQARGSWGISAMAIVQLLGSSLKHWRAQHARTTLIKRYKASNQHFYTVTVISARHRDPAGTCGECWRWEAPHQQSSVARTDAVIVNGDGSYVYSGGIATHEVHLGVQKRCINAVPLGSSRELHNAHIRLNELVAASDNTSRPAVDLDNPYMRLRWFAT